MNAYNTSKFSGRKLFCAKGYTFIFIFLLTFLPGISSFGQNYPEYEEIALFIDVPDLGGRDMDVLILGDEVYLPISDLFDFLMIRNIPSPDLDTITGFFINQDETYLIDKANNQIQYGDQLFELNPGDLIRTETNLYLRGFYFGYIFGLDSEFYFRTMSVRINSRLELPAIREMRLEAMRKNMNRLVGEVEADTVIGRSYPMFHFGMADWSANVTEQLNGRVDSRLSLALGGILAGGEATVVLNYNSYTPFTEKQQYYLWRYVNNNNRAVRQVMLGKIATGATSSIFDPVVGAKVTNGSTQFRRSFGTYTLSDRTEPDWIVELYVNNNLVDYTTADAAGFFTFEVPLVYGNTNVKLKFYGPYGEERVREQNITIPFNFLPKKTIEYSVSAGIVENNLRSTFSRTSVYYGLFSSVTLGAGVEYLSSVSSGPVMPFINGSFRLASNLLLSGEFSPQVRSLGTLTYRLPSSLQFDINYTYYTKGQTAIYNNYRQERKFSMSMPVRFKNFSVYNRLSVNQLVLPSTNYTTSEWLISGALFGVSTNITTYGVFIGNTKPYFYSDFSLSFRLPKNFAITPRAQYSYTNKDFISAKVLAEKRVFKKGYLTASYEQNFRSNSYLIEFGFRYDFKFAQTSVMSRHTKRTTSFIQFARGSIVNDSKTDYVYTDNRANVGKGGISIIPFLDKNSNGILDPGEPKVYGLNIRASAGRIEKRAKDSTIRIFGLEAYTDCFIEFEQSSIDNIAWRLKDRSIRVAVDPNMIKLVEVPINIVGEAAGMVRIEKNGIVRGLGRIIVNFYDKDQNKIARTLSEADGYFTHFGFNPGNFVARIDTAQLRKLGMLSTPDSVNFTIAAYIDGDYVDGLNFIVKYDTNKQAAASQIGLMEPITTGMIVHEEILQDMNAIMDTYTIEVGAFENESEADSLRNQLNTLLGKEANIVIEDDLYKVMVTGFTAMDVVEETFPVLQSNGISEIGLITIKGMLNTSQTNNISGIGTIPVIITKGIIEEDTTSATDSYAIEVGAFENETEASALREQLSTIPGKEANIVFEDNLYKVVVTGFAALAEVEDVYPLLQSNGISEIGLITSQTSNVSGIETIPVVITQGIIEEDTISAADSYAIEVGAFENETEASALRDQLSTIPGKEVNIVLVDNLYKVVVTGFEALAEVEEVYPVLQRNGISEIGLITVKGLLSPAEGTNIQGSETIAEESIKTLVVAKEIIIEDNTSSTDSYTIEVGAFINESEANELREQLSTILGKEVSLFPEDDLYKVRVTGIGTMDEVEETFPVLQRNGINKIGLITFKGMLDPSQDINIQGGETIPAESFSDIVITQQKTREDTTSVSDSYAIEVGAFKNEFEALALQDQLSILLGKEVSLYPEDELYKVRITGIETMDEVEETFPVLISNGINNIGLITYNGMLNQAQVTNIPIVETGSDETLSNVVVTHEKIKKDTTSSTDSYVIEVGAFKTESEANALKDQLGTILGKEVSLFPEDDLYKVRVTGFETIVEIEETYPVLQSNGINKIGLITYKGLLKPDTVISIPAVIVHNILVEDPTSSTDSYAIQLGAFKLKENAQNLRKKLAGILGTDVVITNEEEFYKVRITGFTSSYEVERYIPTLVRHGIREIWVVTLKGTLKPDIVAGEPDIHREVLNTITEKDTTYLIIHNVFEEFITTGPDSYAIQLGTFNRKINADALRAKLVAILGREVKIFVEDELYKVRILDFDTRNEAKEYLPVLHKIGMDDIKVLKLKGMQNYRTAVSILDTISGAQENFSIEETINLTNKKSIEEVKKSTPNSTVVISETITPEKKEVELPIIPAEEKVTTASKVEETPVEIAVIEEPEKEIVKVPYEVERKKSLEERLLDAEYRSGLYEARWPGVEFTIQIAASRSISDPEDIKRKFGLSGNVKVVKVDEWYKFKTGSYIKYWQAREYRNILRTRIGIEDAFIVAYKEGKRIMLTDLIAMVESTPEASTGITVRPEISRGFSIQVLATKDGNISVSDIRNKYQVDDDIYKEFDESDGLYKYSIGNFSTYTGAVKVRNKIRAKGYRDAFVVGYKNGKRVKDLKSILENGK